MSLTSDICDYDPQWPAMFEAERLRIQEKLGHLVREIHHVGSTAVPGMKAKPEIDLLIVVKSISDIDAINSRMAELGYDVRGECGIESRHYYSKNTQSPELIRLMCVKSPTATSPDRLHFVTTCGTTQRTPKNTQNSKWGWPSPI
jgi:GrpB-like predicted nucleotidyltransferase (UPF0157 family)